MTEASRKKGMKMKNANVVLLVILLSSVVFAGVVEVHTASSDVICMVVTGGMGERNLDRGTGRSGDGNYLRGIS